VPALTLPILVGFVASTASADAPAEAPTPTRPLDAYIFPPDYPQRALQARAEGRVGVSLEIGADGRVTGCTVEKSSGYAVLDTSTCRLLRSRARFNPARDSAGAPVPGRYAYERDWKLPR
jgi:periplasmic protein TonB